MRRKRVLATTVLLGLCGTLAAVVAIDVDGTRQRPLDWSQPVAVVVLGARVGPDGFASSTLEARVMHGVALVRFAPLTHAPLVISGGVGTFGNAEGLVGRQLALEAGLSPDDVIPELESHSTRENAQYTAALLRARGLHRVIVVSDPYHLPRARLEFERLGFEVQTSPVLEAPRHQDPAARLWWTLREVLALVKSFVTSSQSPSLPAS